MSQLLALLATGASTPVPPPDPYPVVVIPDPSVTYPSTAPYNVDTYMAFSDPYGHNGSVVHLDVLDMGTAGWKGRRWWMTCTPYYNKNAQEENPCIYKGTNVVTWEPAANNPVYPWPGTGWNSDTELAHDPATDQLVLMYRDENFALRIARSNDGATWPATAGIVTVPGRTEELVSPSLVRLGSTWHLWAVTHPSRAMHHWTAPAPEGPWTGPVVGSGWNTNIWHFNVVHDGTRFLCLMHEGWVEGTAYAASSVDGNAWTRNPTPVLTTQSARAGKWDNGELYRSAIAVHESGTHMRVWYPAYGVGSDSWRVAYTQIPLTEWP